MTHIFNEGILSGIKVLELANVLAGPGVGATLAELGANVIKVENLPGGGDVTRSWKGPSEDPKTDISAYFSCVNWGKRSLALDLNHHKGQEIAHQIVAQTDIVIASYKPGDAEKLKVDYATLSALKPSVIYAHLTGYGPENPRAGYDAIIQAEAGFSLINGEAGGKPTKMPVALMDVLAGHQLKEAILLAILKKERSGKGTYIDVSLLRSAVSSLANQATNWLVGGQIPQACGSDHPNIVPYGTVFYTADKKPLVLAAGTNSQFRNLCQVLEIPQIAQDERFSDNFNRVKNRRDLNKILKTYIGKQSRANLLRLLHERSIPAGGVHDMKEVFEQHEVQAMLFSAVDKSGKALKGVSTIAFRTKDSTFATAPLPPPHFGEHSVEILREYTGLTDLQIQELIDTQTIYDRNFPKTNGLY